MQHHITHSGIQIYKVLGFRCNAFLISKNNHHILVDCGGKRYRRQLIWSLARLGVGHLDALVLTHSHFDHAGNAHYIQNRFATKVIIHEEESGFLRKGDSPIPQGTNPFTRFLVRSLGKFVSKKVVYPGCNAEIRVKGKYPLQPLGFDAYILPTPGHSIGSMSVVIDNEIVLAGDALFGIFPGAVFPPFADDIPQLVASWKTLLDSGAKQFFPAHGSPRKRKTIKRALQIRNKLL